MDNQDFAVFTKVNELAERRGLKAYDFVATFNHDKNAPETSDSYKLAFEVPASGNALRVERFDKMLKDLGLPKDSGHLIGTAEQIIDALDHAISISPRSRVS